MRGNACREGTTEAPAADSIPGAVCQEQKTSPTTTMTTTDSSAGQLEHSVKRVASSDGEPKQEQDVYAKCECKCSCIARLKSYFYSFKLSIMGKLVFSLVAFLVPYDVVTDIIATWELYSSGHGWWGTIAVVILYMSLRFMFLFELMMQKEFLGGKKFAAFQ